MLEREDLLLFELLSERVSQLSKWKNIRRVQENVKQLVPKTCVEPPAGGRERERERERKNQTNP